MNIMIAEQNGIKMIYGITWYDSQTKGNQRKTFFFSFQSLIVLCLAANNIFTITSRFSCTHDHRIHILMLMAHFLVGQKGMWYSHQYSNAFTSVLSFLRMIIKFDYPNICFKGYNHKKGTYDNKNNAHS